MSVSVSLKSTLILSAAQPVFAVVPITKWSPERNQGFTPSPDAASIYETKSRNVLETRSTVAGRVKRPWSDYDVYAIY